jgi:translation initiation factor IF-3
VGEKGEQLGVMPRQQALETARKRGFDLVEVAPTAVTPVCRLLDYGKYKYEQAKKERELRRSQRVSLLREVRFRPNIDNHDFEAKVRTIKKLLDEGDKVKVTIRFRGREITHPELGWRLLQRVSEALQEAAAIARQPVIEGRSMTVIMAPVPPKSTPKAQDVSAEPQVKTGEGVKET